MKPQAEQAEVDRVLAKLRLLSWLSAPVDGALIVLDFLWMAPILALQLARFVAGPSWTNGLWIVVGLIVTSLVWQATRLRGNLVQLEGMIHSLLPLKPFKSHLYKLDNFVDRPALDALMSGFRPESDPVFIKLSRADSQERIYYPLSAYNMAAAGTFVFTPYGPEDMSPLKQFWILHEVGHGEVQNLKQIERPSLARCTGLFLVLWLIMSTDYGAVHTEHAVVAVLALVVIFRMKYLSDCRNESRLVDAEILADNYALIAMSSFDRRKLKVSPEAERERVDAVLRDLRARARRKPSVVLPPDRLLSAEGRERRLARFLANVDSLRAGGGYRVPIIMLAQPWLMVLYVGLFVGVARLPQLPLTAAQVLIAGGVLGIVLLLEVSVLSHRFRTYLAACKKGIDDGVFDPSLFAQSGSTGRYGGRLTQ